MRTIVASPEKLQRLDSLLCRTDSSRFAMNLDLYGIGAFSVKVSKWEVLLYLFEKRLNLPPAAVYRHGCLQSHIKIIGQKRYKLRLLAFLYINVCNYPGNMAQNVYFN